jgi:hypothetical protein
MKEVLKYAIKTKFKNLSRFAAMSGIPHYRIHDVIGSGDEKAMADLLETVKATKVKKLPYEVDQDLIDKVRKQVEGLKDAREWCNEHRIDHYWLQSHFLMGLVRFKNKRVTVLIKALKLN